MTNNTVETIIGAGVVAVAAAFFFYAYGASGKSEGQGGYKLIAEFDNVGAVTAGTDVRLAGIKIGTVIDQTLNTENYQAKLVFSIDPKVSLTDDTSAKVTSEGLLGASYIALDPGGSETKLADGDTITSTQGAVDIWTLISQAMFDKGKTGDGGAGGDTTTTPQ
jgi:phospholipid/cholesterol/gamma-HCH transport system substrate-binding protein